MPLSWFADRGVVCDAVIRFWPFQSIVPYPHLQREFVRCIKHRHIENHRSLKVGCREAKDNETSKRVWFDT